MLPCFALLCRVGLIWFLPSLLQPILVASQGECREGADSELHVSDDPLQCNTGTTFRGRNVLTDAPGCCERPNEAPEAEAQVLDYLLKKAGGNCDVLGTCDLATTIGENGSMSAYDASRAPADDDQWPNNVTTGTSVEVSILLLNVGAPNVKAQTLPITFHFKQSWNDPRLRWRRSAWTHATAIPNGLDRISHVPRSKIWTPDTFFSRMTTGPKSETVEVDYMGNVFWVQEMHGDMACDMPFIAFPFDRPNCWTDIQSYGYQKQVVQFQVGRLLDPEGAGALETVANDEAGVYSVVQLTFENTLVKDRMGDWRETQGDKSQLGSYADLPGILFSIELYHGRTNAFIDFVMKTYIGTLVSCGALFLNPDAVPARAGAAIVTILVNFNNANSAFSRIPELPYPTALHWYLLLSIVITCMNFMEFAMINYCRTNLIRIQNRINLARSRSAADVFFFALMEMDVKEGRFDNIDRATQKIHCNKDWSACLQEFRTKYKADLVDCLAQEMTKPQLERQLAALQEHGVTARQLSEKLGKTVASTDAGQREVLPPVSKERQEAQTSSDADVKALEVLVENDDEEDRFPAPGDPDMSLDDGARLHDLPALRRRFEIPSFALCCRRFRVTESRTRDFEHQWRTWVLIGFHLVSVCWLILVLALGERPAGELVSSSCDQITQAPQAAQTSALQCGSR
eukprot:TRINITY_DN42621_c0_g1_i1.p1 TRINITY_DN42621_c0_g1~~TRINITY_DN42621_c0_g1_i1.p1  ORF type:complete len:686 (-),score=81.86 TRINITY_DN42621_c0_g1_i1:138-2195(-)